MAGRKMLKKLSADIAAEGAKHGMSGIDWLCDQIASGVRMKTIAAPLGVSRNFMYSYVNLGGDEWKSKYAAARLESAGAYADEAIEIADNVEPESGHVQKAKEQVSVRRWLAGSYDRNTYGPKSELQVLAIGELHLDALRKVGAPEALPAPRPALEGGEVEDAEYTVDETEETS